MTQRRLKQVAKITVSNVDKKSVEGDPEVRLCNYTDVYYNDRITSEIQFMAATATPEQVRQFRLLPGDVIITKDSETPDDIGIPALVAESVPNLICGYHLAVVRPGAEVDGRYLFWALAGQQSRTQLAAAATGVTRFGLRYDSIGDLLIRVPELREQRAIADYLDAETTRIDALIQAEKGRGVLALERVRSEVETLVLGREAIQPVINTSLGPVQPIPPGWQLLRNKLFMSEIVDLSQSGDEELLTVSHITGVTPRAEKEVTMFMAESNVGYKRVRPGDLVINTMWAWMGALGVSRTEGIVSPAYGVYRFTRPNFVPAYFDALFRCSAYVAEMTRYSTGVWTSRLRLYPESFLGISSPVPPVDEQSNIAGRVEETRAETDRLAALLARSVSLLEEHRQALITAAVKGELMVPGVAA